PNHPVLTDRGWVALKDLTKGDNVICDALREVGIRGKPNHNGEPVSLEEIHDTLAGFGSGKRIACTAEDFHGDGGDGYIDIVYPHGFLRNRLKSSLFKHLDKLRF